MRRFLTLWTLGLIFATAACEDNPAGPASRTSFGNFEPFGNGAARTFVTVDPAGTPTALGLRWSEAAMANLPMEMLDVVLPLPSDVAVPPFDHLTLGWMPMGHPPFGVYTVPHIDVHAYFISPASRGMISPADPQFGPKAGRPLPADLVPAGYTGSPGAVPGMGAHWLNPLSPEFNGSDFDATFQYGVWDGAIVFMEPLFARSFLDARSEASGTVAQPARWAREGFYPQRWSIEFDAEAREYVLTLGELVAR
jgi:hypothetical protein